MTNKRIQLRRTKGWRLADHSTNAVIVDRRGPYGNPFLIERHTDYAKPWVVWWSDVGPVHSLHNTQQAARTASVGLYRRWVAADLIDPFEWPSQLATAKEHVLLKSALARQDLVGRDVACWCPLDHDCHGDVLLGLAAVGGAS